MTLTVLLDHVPDVVRLSSLLELSPGDKVFDLPDGSDRVPVGLRQPGKVGGNFVVLGDRSRGVRANRNLLRHPLGLLLIVHVHLVAGRLGHAATLTGE